MKKILNVLIVFLLLLFLAGPAFTATPLIDNSFKITDSQNRPVPGGQVYTYEPGTTTPRPTWSDPEGLNPNPNPVTLDAAGKAMIYGKGRYKVDVKDMFGAQVPGFPRDLISPYETYSVATITDLTAKTNMQDGDKVDVGGYFEIGDGGDGVFIWDAQSVETPDNGTIIKNPTITQGRWTRVLNGVAYPEWFGVDGVDDFVQIQAALDVLPASGGTVRLLPKIYKLGNTGITVRPQQNILGAGSEATYINYSGTGYAIKVGEGANLTYGTSLKNFKLYLSNTAGHGKGIWLLGTCGGTYENILIEGYATPGRTNVGVLIDGGNVSSFFNVLTNIYCQHMHIGFKFTSVNNYSTQNTFIQCSSYGDNNAIADGSVGVEINASTGGTTLPNGIDSVWIGGNFENTGTGIKINQHTQCVTFNSVRFEDNDTDVYFGLYSRGCALIGCRNINTVTDASGTGFGRHTFIGCTTSAGNVYPHKFDGGTTFNAVASNNTPLVVKGFSAQTAHLLDLQNSNSISVFSINNDGHVISMDSGAVQLMTGYGSPEGNKTAPVGSLYFNKQAGVAGVSLWVKESGTGNTGWIAK